MRKEYQSQQRHARSRSRQNAGQPTGNPRSGEHGYGARGAFTLIELLVVIAIIAVVAALVIGGIMKVSESARGSNTEATIRTIQKTLMEQWTFVVDEARKETGLSGAFAAMDSPAMFGPDTTGGERNRVIWIKMRLMEAFPESYAEINNPFPYATNIIPANMRKYNAGYKKALTPPGGKAPNTSDNLSGQTESAACLLIALSVMRGGSMLNPDTMPANISDTDGDGIKEIIDSWGNPLAFFRFPTHNQDLQNTFIPKGNKPNFADPVDPGGVLLRHSFTNGTFKKNYEANVHQIASPFQAANANQGNMKSAYVVPVILSAGSDSKIPTSKIAAETRLEYGLDRAITNKMNIKTGATYANVANDNIYSFWLK